MKREKMGKGDKNFWICLRLFLFLDKMNDMNLQTVVKLEKPSFQVDYKTKMMLIGSCFVENIGKKLAYYQFQTEINPCGVVYNPISVKETLNLLLENRPLDISDLLENNGKWVSLKHHGSFSAVSCTEALERMNERLAIAAKQLRKTDVLVITWGTSWVYRYRSTGEIVSNCHRFSAVDFDRFRLSVDEIVDCYTDLLNQLWHLRPDLKVIMTISPVRHWKDGAHGNQLSKAVLLLAMERLCERFKEIYYFPAYELVMDELRDYRFYGEDLLHLSVSGVEYVWEKFKECFLQLDTQEWMRKIERCNKILAHRPFDQDSEMAQELQIRTHEELKRLLQQIHE